MLDRMTTVYSTFDTEEEARRIGEDLVANNLAACVNIFPQMISIYRWQNEFHNGSEVAMIAKTTKENVADVMKEIRRLHTADTPSIFELPVGMTDNDFLEFVNTNTK